jgi:hypothetical protein
MVPTFDSLNPVASAIARLVMPAPYFSATSSRSRSGKRVNSRASRSESERRVACSSGVSADATAIASSSGTWGFRARRWSIATFRAMLSSQVENPAISRRYRPRARQAFSNVREVRSSTSAVAAKR